MALGEREFLGISRDAIAAGSGMPEEQPRSPAHPGDALGAPLGLAPSASIPGQRSRCKNLIMRKAKEGKQENKALLCFQLCSDWQQFHVYLSLVLLRGLQSYWHHLFKKNPFPE